MDPPGTSKIKQIRKERENWPFTTQPANKKEVRTDGWGPFEKKRGKNGVNTQIAIKLTNTLKQGFEIHSGGKKVYQKLGNQTTAEEKGG